MKTIELNKFDVSELSKEELTQITGGSFWSVLGNILGAVVAAGLVVLAAIGISELND